MITDVFWRTVVATLVAFFIAGVARLTFRLVWNRWLRTHIVSFDFLEGSSKLALGRNKLRVAVYPKKRLTLRWFNVRFVPTFRTDRNAPQFDPQQDIELVTCKLDQKGGEQAIFHINDKPDLLGGITFNFVDHSMLPTTWPRGKGEGFFLDIEADVKRPIVAYLSVMVSAPEGGEGRSWGRQQVSGGF